jgi:hypothetical protein
VASIKLLWLPGPVNYRLRLFEGPNAQRRGFAGELTLTPAGAQLLHGLLEQGNDDLGDPISQTGWVEPATVAR